MDQLPDTLVPKPTLGEINEPPLDLAHCPALSMAHRASINIAKSGRRSMRTMPSISGQGGYFAQLRALAEGTSQPDIRMTW
jgi:hypothetical protein